MHFHLMSDVRIAGAGAGASSAPSASASAGMSAAPISSTAVRAYLTDSSIHRSFYRCVSIHGTHGALISQNVAFDAIGHCYYLEDGVEEDNVFVNNLAAHIHVLGSPARGNGGGQTCSDIDSSEDLLLPADVTASGFYVTNAHNTFEGNAASGGWAGFAFPTLSAPIKTHRCSHPRSCTVPSSRALLRFDGNSAHSAGFWWHSAGQIYVGGKLWHPYSSSSILRYNPCRTLPGRSGLTRMTNTKVFIGRGVGVSHWGRRPELIGFEAHDLALAASIMGDGFLNHALVICRTGAALQAPCENGCDQGAALSSVQGSGFEWYDTSQGAAAPAAAPSSCADGSNAGLSPRISSASGATRSHHRVTVGSFPHFLPFDSLTPPSSSPPLHPSAHYRQHHLSKVRR